MCCFVYIHNGKKIIEKCFVKVYNNLFVVRSEANIIVEKVPIRASLVAIIDS